MALVRLPFEDASVTVDVMPETVELAKSLLRNGVSVSWVRETYDKEKQAPIMKIAIDRPLDLMRLGEIVSRHGLRLGVFSEQANFDTMEAKFIVMRRLVNPGVMGVVELAFEPEFKDAMKWALDRNTTQEIQEVMGI